MESNRIKCREMSPNCQALKSKELWPRLVCPPHVFSIAVHSVQCMQRREFISMLPVIEDFVLCPHQRNTANSSNTGNQFCVLVQSNISV